MPTEKKNREAYIKDVVENHNTCPECGHKGKMVLEELQDDDYFPVIDFECTNCGLRYTNVDVGEKETFDRRVKEMEKENAN